MKILLFVFCVIDFVIGLAMVVFAKSAVHEVSGFIFLLMATVLFCAAAIVEALGQSKQAR